MIYNIPFTKMNIVTERIALIFNSYLKESLENVTSRKFNEVTISGSHGISKHKKGRHPSSILKTAMPTFHLAYDMSIRKEETTMSSSAFSTDVGYINPIDISDQFMFRDTFKDTIEVRHSFDIVSINVDIAIVEETKQKQIATKRLFDILYETTKVYELPSIMEMPLSEKVINYWVRRFHNGIKPPNDILLKELQQFSFYNMKIIRDASTGKDTIVLSFPITVQVAFEDAEMNDGDEEGLTTSRFIVARIAKVVFNAPSMVVLVIDKKDNGVFEEIKLEDTTLYPGNKIALDKTLETYDGKTAIYHTGINMKDSIVALRPILLKYEDFLQWYINTHDSFEDVLKIVVRDSHEVSSNKSYESSSKVDISYKSDLLLRNNSDDNTQYDIKIYLDLFEYNKYIGVTSVDAYDPTRENLDTFVSVNEVSVSESLMDIINKGGDI